MDTIEALFERFGKLLTENVRDRELHYFERFLDQEVPLAARYKDELGNMTLEQIEMMKEMATRLVDGVLHDMLLLLEDEDWISLRLLGDEVVIDDIRRASKGPMQGYVFIWAEKYSKQRLVDYTERS